jgi:hypothetical protein
MVALPAVLVSPNIVLPPELLVMVALPAMLVLRKTTDPPELLVMMALPAVLLLEKAVCPALTLVKMGLFEESLTMPVPVICKARESSISKEYAGAPALN